MPRVRLDGPLTYPDRPHGPRSSVEHVYRRGVETEVDYSTYLRLLRTGHFSDPVFSVQWCRPSQLRHFTKRHRKITVPVVRDIGLGDVLMVTIPLREFALDHPEIDVVYAVHASFVPIVKGLPFCKKVCAVDELRGDYAAGIELRSYVENHLKAHSVDRIDLFAHYLIGRRPKSYSYPIQVPDEWRARGRAVLGINGQERPTMLLATRASMLNRSWGDDYNRELCELAVADGWRVALTDQRRKKDPFIIDHEQVLDLRGKLSAEELAWAVSAASVVVSPDTGTTHLAEALKTRCVAYYTTVPPELRVGHYQYTRVLYPESELSCLGCIHSPRCTIKDGHGRRRPHPDPRPCANLTTPAMVWEQVLFTQNHQPPWQVYSWRDPTPARPSTRPSSPRSSSSDVIIRPSQGLRP